MQNRRQFLVVEVSQCPACMSKGCGADATWTISHGGSTIAHCDAHLAWELRELWHYNTTSQDTPMRVTPVTPIWYEISKTRA